MMQALSRVRNWISGGALLFAGGVVGGIGNHYMESRTAYKEALNANYQQFNEAALNIEDSLKEFAEIARGAKPKTSDDVSQLQTRLLTAVEVADDLQRRLGHTTNVVDGYKSAAVELKHASDTVTGPLDAKSLVTAVSDYLVAEQRLKDVVVAEHTSFLY